MLIQGAMTAMVTPFKHGVVDFERLVANAQFQLDAGIDALVPMGTTGESPTLSHEEHRKVTEHVIAAVRAFNANNARKKSKRLVIAGVGSNATSEALELTRHAKDVGADAVLSVIPYYNKPTQEGQYRHFATVADAVEIPTVLYNIPGRCGVAMLPATVARLAKHPNIVAVKESTGNMDSASEIASLVDLRKFSIVSGDDSLTLPIMSVGGRGTISVLSNLVPARIKALVDAMLQGDIAKAQKLHLALFPLCRAMFIETNPIPIKTAMAICGMDTGALRLPMCEMAESNRKALEKALAENGVKA